MITLLYVQTARHEFTVCDDNVYIYEKPQISGGRHGRTPLGLRRLPRGKLAPPDLDLAHDRLAVVRRELGTGKQALHDELGRRHHLVSMGIHCANAVLLFLALRLMTGTLWPSFVVAALFAVHPLRVESVAWAAERKDVLCGLFWMASMLAYAFYARRRPLARIFAAGGGGHARHLFAGDAAVRHGAVGEVDGGHAAVRLPPSGRLALEPLAECPWPPGQHAEAGPDLTAGVGLLAEKIPWFGMVDLRLPCRPWSGRTRAWR